MRFQRIEEPVFRSLEILTLTMLAGCTAWVMLLSCGIWLRPWLH